MRKTIFLTACAILVSQAPARADYAFVLTTTLCQNQSNSMNTVWYKSNYTADGSMKLFYFDGTTFKSADAAAKFETYAKVGITSHGNIGRIAEMPGEDFAKQFKDARKDAVPTDVNFMACYSASVPDSGGLSVVGQVASQFLKSGSNDTKISRLRASVGSCRLEKGNAPVVALGEAVYRSKVGDSSPEAAKLIEELKQEWGSKLYPGSKLTFKAFCEKMEKPKDVQAFVDAVFTEFKTKYIELIKLNTGGGPLYECGADIADQHACK